MKKPTPPPVEGGPQAPASREAVQFADSHPPIASPLNFTQESPFINPIDNPPNFGAGLASDSICGQCKNLWAMELGGQIKNLKPDGSEYTTVERYCIFGENLVSLAERAVRKCSRFERKL